jgi:hypothetical protein
VNEIAALREGRGEFASEKDFYKFWRGYPFKIGAATSKLLEKLLAAQGKK